MRSTRVLVLGLLLLGACATSEDTATDDGFSLAGTIERVEAGVEPEQLPEPTGDTNDAQTGGDRSGEAGASEGGALHIEVDNLNALEADVRDCQQGEGTFLVYYTDETTFVPADAPEEKDFPDLLEGSDVELSGTKHRATGDEVDSEGACTLVADTVTVSETSTGQNPGEPQRFTPGPRPNEATPGVDDSPEDDPESPAATGAATTSP